MVYQKQSGHIGGSFSICEIISYLYSNYDLINKDKLILSKGHAVPTLYAIFQEMDLLFENELFTFREIDSRLQGHPDKNRLKYLHATTGSLGQGLSIALGHALAFKIKKLNNKVFCILGDGEMQEGQVWEALMLAPALHLDNLICIIDYNKFQSEGPIKNLTNLNKKIHSFNWRVYEIKDGNNLNEIENTFSKLKYITDLEGLESYPSCIIAYTKKGAGISFLEDTNCHSTTLKEEQYHLALKELGYE